jgi:FlaA1/EpsC-like NDP-sugar epimerase
LRDAASRVRADTVIIAIPSAESELIREVSALAVAAGLTVKVLPQVSRFFRGAEVAAGDVRAVSEADLLGRRIVDTEIENVAGYLTGRRVLVTGAGGSIGSELCRQIHRFAPSALVMLDRDESGLHQVQLSIEGRALLDDRSLVVCDIRDEEALDAAFAEHRPEVVFHAAALKHLPLLEMWPAEAVKTNVQGTQHVLAAAAAAGVERFVNISTDKAANPCSVLGYTKRLAEGLTAGMADEADGTFLSVRFGNVLGSSGSVLRSFRAQIDAGGPVTVTDPQVTRYFMMVEEAVQLVIQAGAVGQAGEVLVLDMGQPVRIAEVAERLIADSKRSIKIVYTGLRPGEKMHEDLFGEGEVDLRPVHPHISHVRVPPISSVWAEQFLAPLAGTGLKRQLRELCRRFDAIASAVQSRAAGA